MIPKIFIDELLHKVDIELIVSSCVELVPNGAQLRGICPFCQSNKPMFTLSVNKQIYKCFKCGRGGNAIKFIVDIEKKTFPEAIYFLATKLDMEVPKSED